MEKLINSLIYTLGTIEVKGKANLDALLGCILTLEQLKEKISQAVKNDDTENKQG